MASTLEQETEICRVLADPSRLRMLALLQQHSLSATELNRITGLAQSRISTHLARLSQAGLVTSQRVGTSNRYAIDTQGGPALALWEVLRERLNDSHIQLDRERAHQVIQHRKNVRSWAESAAGRMELHYSPGRTWEATARALMGTVKLGRVLDIASGDGVLAELIAAHAQSVTCMDISPRVLHAAQNRLSGFANVDLCCADMHEPPFQAQSFDHIFIMHALPYTNEPARVLENAADLLCPHGKLTIATLDAHHHKVAMKAYDHVNLGLAPENLGRMLEAAGLKTRQCSVSSREIKPPYFKVITAFAEREV